MHVTVTTLEFVGGGSNKFYRMYQADADDTNLYLQYGSQNNGRSGGQFLALAHNNLSARDREWVKRLNDKRSEGYSRVNEETGGFEIADYEKSRGTIGGGDNKAFARWVSVQYDKNWTNRTNVPPKKAPDKAPAGSPVSAPSTDVLGKGTLEVLNDRLLAALLKASDDPIAGYAQLALLKIDIEAAKTEMRKLEDYRDTLEMMTEDNL